VGGAVDILREAGTPTVPTTVAHERAVNPFLRSREPVRQAVRAQGGDVSDDAAAFGALRGWKDGFR
jgi:hydroxyacylglutathione hydrolase